MKIGNKAKSYYNAYLQNHMGVMATHELYTRMYCLLMIKGHRRSELTC